MQSSTEDRLRRLQMADLGTARREYISTADDPKKSYHVRMEDLEATRRSNIPGTIEQRQAQMNKASLDAWNNLHKNISDTAGQEDLVNIMQGQSHRHALNLQLHGPTPQRPVQHAAPKQPVQQAIKKPAPKPAPQPSPEPIKPPVQQANKKPVQKPAPQPAPQPTPQPTPQSTVSQPKGNHPNPSPSPGRGGGVIGTRGRGSKPVRADIELYSVRKARSTSLASAESRPDSTAASNRSASPKRSRGGSRWNRGHGKSGKRSSRSGANPTVLKGAATRARRPESAIDFSRNITAPELFLAAARQTIPSLVPSPEPPATPLANAGPAPVEQVNPALSDPAAEITIPTKTPGQIHTPQLPLTASPITVAETPTPPPRTVPLNKTAAFHKPLPSGPKAQLKANPETRAPLNPQAKANTKPVLSSASEAPPNMPAPKTENVMKAKIQALLKDTPQKNQEAHHGDVTHGKKSLSGVLLDFNALHQDTPAPASESLLTSPGIAELSGLEFLQQASQPLAGEVEGVAKTEDPTEIFTQSALARVGLSMDMSVTDALKAVEEAHQAAQELTNKLAGYKAIFEGKAGKTSNNQPVPKTPPLLPVAQPVEQITPSPSTHGPFKNYDLFESSSAIAYTDTPTAKRMQMPNFTNYRSPAQDSSSTETEKEKPGMKLRISGPATQEMKDQTASATDQSPAPNFKPRVPSELAKSIHAMPYTTGHRLGAARVIGPAPSLHKDTARKLVREVEVPVLVDVSTRARAAELAPALLQGLAQSSSNVPKGAGAQKKRERAPALDSGFWGISDDENVTAPAQKKPLESGIWGSSEDESAMPAAKKKPARAPLEAGMWGDPNDAPEAASMPKVIGPQPWKPKPKRH